MFLSDLIPAPWAAQDYKISVFLGLLLYLTVNAQQLLNGSRIYYFRLCAVDF